ncbi:hypothetical protein IMSHALPRED_008268 [Imshaugia aleurites]|uniref:Ankyrin n=1 Tax=Imshaugia aleurites TaxID=172621 RepID=A0A8H3IX95_9LECA|nr:hypothetical protein IMSHALPRED_008268 [Imshaugia aleurites]
MVNQFTAAIRRAAETLAVGTGVDTQHTWGKNISALCQAATINCHPRTVLHLLSSKKERSSACNDNESMKSIMEIQDEVDVLVGAAYTGNFAKVREILASNYDVQRGSRFFGSPLQCACSRGYKDIVILILEHGADVNDGELPLGVLSPRHTYPLGFGTPLQSACLGGHGDIVRLLLEPKYELSTSHSEYYIAALQAARGGHLNVLTLLIEKAAPGTIEREFLLSEASKHGQEDLVRIILNNETSMIPDLRYALGLSLEEAANRGYHQIVRLLLAHGANEELETLWGSFYAASRGGYEQVVRLLLEHRAEEWPDVLGPAASKGQAHIIAFLLESQVNRQSEWWSYYAGSALEVATKEGYDSVVRILVDHGVNLRKAMRTIPAKKIIKRKITARKVKSSQVRDDIGSRA